MMRVRKSGTLLFGIIIMLNNKTASTIALATVGCLVVGAIAVEIYVAIKEEPEPFGMQEYSKPKTLPPIETKCGAVCGAVCGGNIHDQEKRTTPDE